MFSFPHGDALPYLPSGFVLDSQKVPNPNELNKLLSHCREATHSRERLKLACERSLFHLSIVDELNGKLVGFVRATSDHGLNANLWNLVAEPGDNQQQFFEVLVHRSLQILRRDIPGCSISVAAPPIAFNALENQGFLLNPGGIRTMSLRLR